MKAVVFDFDGTLSKKGNNIWKKIWIASNQSIDVDSAYRRLFTEFINGEISHQEWCDKTCVELKKNGFRKTDEEFIAKSIILNDGFIQTVLTLKEQGYLIYIVSGGVKSIIEKSLGYMKNYFNGIFANELIYDNLNNLFAIKGTKYDFEGKAIFVQKLSLAKDIKPQDITFIGNSLNDEWVYKTGCKTVCINPELADYQNSDIWQKCIHNLTNLTQLLSVILDNKKLESNNSKNKE